MSQMEVKDSLFKYVVAKVEKDDLSTDEEYVGTLYTRTCAFEQVNIKIEIENEDLDSATEFSISKGTYCHGMDTDVAPKIEKVTPFHTDSIDCQKNCPEIVSKTIVHTKTRKNKSRISKQQASNLTLQNKKRNIKRPTQEVAQKQDVPVVVLTSQKKKFKCDRCPFQAKYRRLLKCHIDIHEMVAKKTDYKTITCIF